MSEEWLAEMLRRDDVDRFAGRKEIAMSDLKAMDNSQLIDRALESMKELKRRFDEPEWKCVECKVSQPSRHYRYQAHNKDTGEIISPLCALCIRGETSQRFIGPPWKHRSEEHTSELQSRLHL